MYGCLNLIAIQLEGVWITAGRSRSGRRWREASFAECPPTGVWRSINPKAELIASASIEAGFRRLDTFVASNPIPVKSALGRFRQLAPHDRLPLTLRGPASHAQVDVAAGQALEEEHAWRS